MNPDKEDFDSDIINPTGFSGYNLIDEFLNENEGYQILVSTASNKIWNVDAALKRGAKGYYIKESPEFNYPISETKKRFDKFKTDVDNCFENAYLQDVYSSINEIKKQLPTDDFGAVIGKQLELAFYLISKAEKEDQYAFAFISLYMVIELINKKPIGQHLISYSVEQEKVYVNRTDDLKYRYWDINNSEFVVSNKTIDAPELLLDYCIRKGKGVDLADDGSVRKTRTINFGEASEFVKIANFMKDNGLDDETIIDVSHRIQARNWYVHKDPKLDKKYNTIQREIYTKTGFQALFNDIKAICSCL